MNVAHEKRANSPERALFVVSPGRTGIISKLLEIVLNPTDSIARSVCIVHLRLPANSLEITHFSRFFKHYEEVCIFKSSYTIAQKS